MSNNKYGGEKRRKTAIQNNSNNKFERQLCGAAKNDKRKKFAKKKINKNKM